MNADIKEEKDVFDLIYKLDDNPPVKEAMFAALQHLLAIIVGIITPTLIIGGVLGLGSEIPYLISMALIVSGVAFSIMNTNIFIQESKIKIWLGCVLVKIIDTEPEKDLRKKEVTARNQTRKQERSGQDA